MKHPAKLRQARIPAEEVVKGVSERWLENPAIAAVARC
jgi:hypothetical protein